MGSGRGEEKDSSLTCSSAVQYWLVSGLTLNWECGFGTQVESNCSFNTKDKNDITLQYSSNAAVHNKWQMCCGIRGVQIHTLHLQ